MKERGHYIHLKRNLRPPPNFSCKKKSPNKLLLGNDYEYLAKVFLIELEINIGNYKD
jgi:hypothetical protein